jgi:uncharacterized protein (TIGR02118 family)
MIKVLAAFNRKAGWSVDEFLCHYQERHAPLIAGTAGFTRHCRRYAQNYPELRLDARPEPHLARDAISEMWFESLEAMGATYSAPDYLERARPDEQRFADFNSALVYVCEEHELKRQVDSGEPDKQWAHLPPVKLFIFYSASDASRVSVWQAARMHAELEKTDAEMAQLVRGHVFSRRLTAPAADLPSQGLDTIAGVDEFRFACISDARLFADQFLGCGEQHAKRGETHGVNISGAFLAHTHLVFSCD